MSVIKGNLPDNLIKSSLLILNITAHLIQFKCHSTMPRRGLFVGNVHTRVISILHTSFFFVLKISINASTGTTQYDSTESSCQNKIPTQLPAYSHLNNFYYYGLIHTRSFLHNNSWIACPIVSFNFKPFLWKGRNKLQSYNWHFKWFKYGNIFN